MRVIKVEYPKLYEKLDELVCRRGYIVACTGSPLKSDDRFGLFVCERLLGIGLPVIPCEYRLETCLG